MPLHLDGPPIARLYRGSVPIARAYNGPELIFERAAAYTANAVHFDGTNDWLSRGAGLTGAADSKLLTFSVWLNSTDAAGAQQIFHHEGSGAANRTRLFKQSSSATRPNSFAIRGHAAGDTNTTVLSLESSSNSLAASFGWVNILLSVDVSDSGKRHLYINDSADLDAVLTYTDAVIDFTLTDCGVGGRGSDGNALISADMADLWYAPGVYIDFSVEANRRKFISAAGEPVDLGADGRAPTRSAPLVFLSGATEGWHINKGTGGGFTENGALTTATPPG